MIEISLRETCPVCEGRGFDLYYEQICARCKGERYVQQWITLAAFIETFVRPEVPR